MNAQPLPNPLDSKCQCPSCKEIVPLSFASKHQAISVYFFACNCGTCVFLTQAPDASLVPPSVGHDGLTTIGLVLQQKVAKVLIPGTRAAPKVDIQ